jgi:hypothetical protein
MASRLAIRLARARRKEIYEALHPETSADAFHGNRHTSSLRQNGDGYKTRFTKEAARITGKSESAFGRSPKTYIAQS